MEGKTLIKYISNLFSPSYSDEMKIHFSTQCIFISATVFICHDLQVNCMYITYVHNLLHAKNTDYCLQGTSERWALKVDYH